MKRSITLLTVLFCVSIMNQAFAQEKGEFRVGISGSLGTEVGISATGDENETKPGYGLNLQAEYFVSDWLSFSLNFNNYFKVTDEYSSVDTILSVPIKMTTGLTSKLSNLNAEAKAYVLRRDYFTGKGINIYLLAGGVIMFSDVEVESTVSGTGMTTTYNKTTNNDTKMGFTAGAGLEYAFENGLFVFMQGKYESPIKQFVGNLGVGYSF